MRTRLIKLILALVLQKLLLASFSNGSFLTNKSDNFYCSTFKAIEIFVKLQTTCKVSTVKVFNTPGCDILETLHRHKIAVEIVTFENLPEVITLKSSFSIIFANDIEDFNSFVKIVSDDNFHFNGCFLLVLNDDFLEPKMNEIFETLWKKFIFNVNVLIAERNTTKVSLFTFMPFNEKSCNNVNPIKINEFDAETMKWSKEIFFPKKFTNLHKCPIKVGMFENLLGGMKSKHENGSENYFGLEIDFIKSIAATLNFSIDLKIFPNIVGTIFKNKTSSELLGRAQNNEVDLIFALMSLQQTRREILSETRLFFTDKMILVVPKASPIGSLKKLFAPFDILTWILIVIFLFVAFCVVTTVACFSKAKNFVIGRDIDAGFLNVWNVLLGGSQSKLPTRNFARFLLMQFIIFCLIIRNSYSGSLFSILTFENTKELSSIHELDQLGYTFYMYESLALRLQDEKTMIK